MYQYLENLNVAQKEATTTLYGPLLIRAGAGTGKTTTIVSRVAYAIDSGIDPSEILLLTFTNKAAKEMKQRVIKLVGKNAEKVTACTFHAFCANFLRHYAHLMNLSNSFTILDEADSNEAMSIIRAEYLGEQKSKGIEYKAGEFPSVKALMGVYSSTINSCSLLQTIIDESNLYNFKSDIVEIMRHFREYKMERQYVDYDDLLLFTFEMLNKYPDISQSLDKFYTIKMIDEYQDTNIIQDKIIELISRINPNLAVVGDMHQSIYKFRGAHVGNIMGFEKRNPNCKIITINENYRSSQEILNLSNAFMEHIHEGIPNHLNGQISGTPPQLIVVRDAGEESQFITDKIIQYHKNGIKYNDIAIIERNSTLSYQLETSLNKSGIPFNKYGGTKFIDKSYVRDVLAFLKVITNYSDEIALYRILQLYPGIGKIYSKKIALEVRNNGIDVLKTLYPNRKFAIYLTEIYNTLQKLKTMYLSDQLHYLIEEYYQQICLRVINQSTMTSEKKEDCIIALPIQQQDLRALYELSNGYTSTPKFLNDLTLDNSENADKNDRVTVTTIHSAKGLEYEVVFIMDVIEGITPRTTEHDKENDAEEQRCFYVAITRAKKELYLMVPQTSLVYGKGFVKSYLSHFIDKDNILDSIQCNVPMHQLNALRSSSEDDWDNIFM